MQEIPEMQIWSLGLENLMDRGAWWATVHAVAESDMTEHAHTASSLFFIHKKERNPPIYDNMDELWGHYAKQTEPERGRQILYNLTYM